MVGWGTYLAFPLPVLLSFPSPFPSLPFLISSPLPLPPLPPPWLPSRMVQDSRWTVVDHGCARYQPKSRWWKDVAGGSCRQPRGRLTTEWVTGVRPVLGGVARGGGGG